MSVETTEETTVEETTEPTVEPVETTTEPITETTEEPKSFSEDYVKTLRRESAGYREKAKRSDDLAARLHAALVTSSGRLQDPTDLPFDESHLESPEALTAAIDALLGSKPHLASRKPQGTIPQGATPEAGTTVGLAGLLRAHAS